MKHSDKRVLYIGYQHKNVQHSGYLLATTRPFVASYPSFHHTPSSTGHSTLVQCLTLKILTSKPINLSE